MAGIGEKPYPVGTVCLDGVNVRGCNNFGHLVPARTHEAATTTNGRIATTFVRITDDRGPGLDGFHGLTCASPQLHESRTDQRVLQTIATV